MLYDISPPIDAQLKVFPGDTPLSREVLLDMAKGDHITLSTLRGTVHIGAHADGPNHYGVDGRAIDEQPLDLYLGRCEVVHVDAERGSRIGREQLPPSIRAERLLIATGTYPDPADFNLDFAALEPALVTALHEEGVRLIGVDTPSVDTADSTDLPAHREFFRCDVAILEGLVLRDVPAGLYELIALPLPLVGFDASPVRAVLRELEGA